MNPDPVRPSVADMVEQCFGSLNRRVEALELERERLRVVLCFCDGVLLVAETGAPINLEGAKEARRRIAEVIHA